jgi:hypothetical protein
MRSVRIALVAGLTLLAVAIALTLLGSPLSVAATNRPPGGEAQQIASTRGGGDYCQAGETLPRGTSAIRVSLSASIGPRVRLAVSSGGRELTSGAEDPGWTGLVVGVPVRPLARTVSAATVCVSFHVAHETVALLGQRTPAASAARAGRAALAGRMWIEYLRPGSRSWASLAAAVVRHMGLGRAWSGSGIVFLALALLVAVGVLASALVLVELR